MARIRSIKPEFWTDEKVVELPAMARLLFIGLWNFADDDGRMVLSAKRLKLQIFPADKCDISALLGELRGNSLIAIYQVDGIEYLQVNGFAKHQKVDKRTASKHPAPPNSPEPRRIPPPEGIKEGIKEGSGGDAAVAAPAPGDSRLGSRLPEDWKPDKDLEAWSTATRPDLNFDTVLADFRDFWLAKPGAAGRKLDWNRTFKRWVRNEKQKRAPATEGPKFGPKPFRPVDREAIWRPRLEMFAKSGTWLSSWGPKPGEPHCEVPPALLKEALPGYDRDRELDDTITGMARLRA